MGLHVIESLQITSLQWDDPVSFHPTIAEGVEAQEQADFLAAIGCRTLQGDMLGRAVPPGEFFSRWAGRA